MIRGQAPRLGNAVEILVVDDDEPCGAAHPRTAFVQALEASQVDASVVTAPTPGSDAPLCVAVFGELRGHRSEVTYRSETLEKISDACLTAARARREAVIVLFAPPALGAQIHGSAPIVCGWSGDRCMQEAVARWLLR